MEHATNYTAAHESRAGIVGPERLDYPDFHVESDNRLSWFLGSLDHLYGDAPIYVHLTRNVDDVVASYRDRRHGPHFMMPAFGHAILTARDLDDEQWADVARMFVNSVNRNIDLFLRDKSRVVRMTLEDPLPSVHRVWEMAGMEGDLGAALAEWSVRHNASDEVSEEL